LVALVVFIEKWYAFTSHIDTAVENILQIDLTCPAFLPFAACCAAMCLSSVMLQTSTFAGNERMVAMTETPAQSGRALNSTH
jgi:hypothetical protein